MSDLVLGALIALAGVFFGNIILVVNQVLSNRSAVSIEKLRISSQHLLEAKAEILKRAEAFLRLADHVMRSVQQQDLDGAWQEMEHTTELGDQLILVADAEIMPLVTAVVTALVAYEADPLNDDAHAAIYASRSQLIAAIRDSIQVDT